MAAGPAGADPGTAAAHQECVVRRVLASSDQAVSRAATLGHQPLRAVSATAQLSPGAGRSAEGAEQEVVGGARATIDTLTVREYLRAAG